MEGAREHAPQAIYRYVKSISRREIRSEIQRQTRAFLLGKLVDAVNEQLDLDPAITAESIDRFVAMLSDPLLYADLFIQNEFTTWFNDNATRS